MIMLAISTTYSPTVDFFAIADVLVHRELTSYIKI